ncbi:hypothetical protein ABEF95_010341 [Exophiala dermatitidis]
MVESPALDQFPTFAETRDRLKESFCQCIWYLPDKGRHCKVEIVKDDKEESLQLASEVIQMKGTPLSQESLQKRLAAIAELSCCSQYHRNIFWGRGLVDMLAERWRKEIIDSLPPCITTAFVPVVAEPKEIKHPSNGGVTRLVLDQVLENNTQSQYPLRPVTFAKHAVLEGQTLMSTLLSNIDPSAPKGSVYIFTYTNKAFEGMLKIGFTSRPAVHRLDEWEECGYGKPSPLETFSGVRHPERVECLTHFELIKYWYAWRWCNEHKRAHIEWFKVDLSTATRVAQNWASWMERADPYDKRGGFLASWRGNIEFLKEFDIDITAELMMEIQQVEEGLIDVTSFIDDDELRGLHKPMVKQNIPIRSRARRRCVSSTPLNSSGNQLER